MSTIGQNYVTLLDYAKMKSPDGALAQVVERLTKASPLLEDMAWQEGNLDTGELVTFRSGLPAISWRRVNEGVLVTKGETNQYTETCGIMTGLSMIDSALLSNMGGNGPAFRGSQDMAFLTSMRNQMENSIFYESTKTTPERLMGLAPRFDALSGVLANQIISSTAGGAPSGSDQTSIWIVNWGPDKVYGVFPKGSKAGFEMIDRGEIPTESSTGKKYFAWATEFNWRAGLVVKDPRYVMRIANIDTSGLSSTGKAILQDIARGLERIQDLDGKPVIYCNRKIREFLRLQAMDSTTNSTLRVDNTVQSKQVLYFDEVPIKRTDAILNTESIVS